MKPRPNAGERDELREAKRRIRLLEQETRYRADALLGDELRDALVSEAVQVPLNGVGVSGQRLGAASEASQRLDPNADFDVVARADAVADWSAAIDDAFSVCFTWVGIASVGGGAPG